MAGLDLRAKRRVRRRRQADSGFFDSNCSNDIPSPDNEQRSVLEATKETSSVSVLFKHIFNMFVYVAKIRKYTHFCFIQPVFYLLTFHPVNFKSPPFFVW